MHWTYLDKHFLVSVFASPQLKRQRASSRSNVVGEPIGYPVQVEQALQVEDIGVVGDQKQELVRWVL